MRQCLVVVGVLLMSACASSSARVTPQPPPVILVAAPLPQCMAGEPRAVEAGLPRCTCLPAEATVCRGGDCSCVIPKPKEKDSNDSVLVFLLGLAIGAL
jgi:hypothetical protein